LDVIRFKEKCQFLSGLPKASLLDLPGTLQYIAGVPKTKSRAEENEFVEYLTRAIRSLGVKTETGVLIGPEATAKLQDFDEVVIATGGIPICLPLPETQSNVALAEDVLQNRTRLGSKIVVIGGGMVGCETAEWIAKDGKQVIIVEQWAEVAGDMESRTRKLLLDRLESYKVEIICKTKVECLEKDKIICCQGGLRLEMEGVDNIVLALGYRANSFIPQVPSKKVHRIGDCVQPRKAIEAVHEGFLLGVEL
jgi:pyruvate/2-oxoglutarate dehydrogenase complex dihydrolipoamide dehydrogenase (E3) component